jgi:hypothetical protein
MGSDSKYWLPAILKDFKMLQQKQCIVNPTTVKPPGTHNPPAVEQRFKIKYRKDVPISLGALDPAQWKARTVARGDRFIKGIHYNATAAPVVHATSLKMLLAWAVQNGLLLFQFDEESAFYGNEMDVKGVVVRLPAGFHPNSSQLRPLNAPPLYGELAKGVPGIPQGSLLHFEGMNKTLHANGFKSIQADCCLFLHNNIDMAMSIHVDDGVLAAPSLEHARQVLGPNGLGATRKLT